MNQKIKLLCFGTLFSTIILSSSMLHAQMWERKSERFNSSGIPSLSFSQPRFADLDADGDQDLILGSISALPNYFENVGSAKNPIFKKVNEVLEVIEELDAELAVPADIDSDGDLDLITGGYTGLHLYKNTGSPENPNFEKVAGAFKLSTGSNPIPSLADIDNDGDLDLLVGLSENGTLLLFINKGTPENYEFSDTASISIDDVGLYAYSSFCDFDGDNDYDILSGRDGYGLYYYENKGNAESPDWYLKNTIFSGMATSTYFNSPDLVDLDGDSKYEVVYGSGNGPLNYYKNEGTIESPSWLKKDELFGGILDVGGASTPIFIDYDGDEDLDMLSGSTLGNIKYFENVGTKKDGQWKEKSSINSLKHSIYSFVTMADVNNDGLIDALVGDLSGNVFLHLRNEVSYSKVSSSFDEINLGGFASPRLIDLNGDDVLDVVAGSEDGALFYFENTGDKENPFWTEIPNYFATITANANSVPAMGDIDKDGDLDLLVGNLSGTLNYYTNEDGAWIENNTLFAGIEVDQNAAPAFADIDADGDDDLILGNYDGFFDYYENKTITIIDGNKQRYATNNIVVNTFPNPFTEYIEFELPELPKGQINLEIYNVLGKIIYRQEQNCFGMGPSTIYVSNLSKLPSGTYFYTIKLNANKGQHYFSGKLIK